MTAYSLLRRVMLCLCGLAGVPAATHADPLPSHLLEPIAAHEYRASGAADGLQAPNRAHGFRTRFDARGITVVERDADAEPLLALELAKWGRPGELARPAPGVLVPQGPRVERRSGALTEWYVNTPKGLEHGFDVHLPPPGDGPLEFHLRSNQPARQVHADRIDFGSGDGALRYEHLKVWDADGRVLAARMQVDSAHHVVIRVDDAGARYPLTVDPLLARSADLVRNGPQAGAEFGIRIANAGDVNGDGIDDLVVGAFRYDDGATDNGAAFVFTSPNFNSPSFLTVVQAEAAFGAGVGGAGDLNNDGFDDVVVGAPSFDGPNGADAGAAYVYFGGSGAFEPFVDATIPGPQPGANMGGAVRGVGDVNNDGFDDLAVGVPRYDVPGTTLIDQGGAFVYYGGAPFNTTADAVLAVAKADTNAGTSIAAGDLNGDGRPDVVVGATGYESTTALTNEGAALLFFGGTGPIDTTADAVLPSGQAGATGSASVATGDINGDGIDDLLSGAPLSFGPGGALQAWHGGAGAFNTQADVQIVGNEASAQLGRSVAILPDLNADGRDELVAGAPTAPNPAGQSTGEAKIYLSSPLGFDSTPSLELVGSEPGGQFGTSVAVGRFNGDAVFDLAVGEPLRDVGATANAGTTYVYFGQPVNVFRDGFE